MKLLKTDYTSTYSQDLQIEGFVKDKITNKATNIWSISIDAYQFTQCKKCEAPSLHIDSYFMKEFNEKTDEKFKKLKKDLNNFGKSDEDKYKSMSYPNFSYDSLKDRKWSFNLPKEDMLLFFEVIAAWENGLFTLALSGIRTLIDRYIVNKVGDVGTFQSKLKKMLEEKHLNKKQYELLATIIEGGNAAGHRGFRPKKEMLDNFLQIVEEIISLDYKTDDFEKYNEIIPKREKP